MRSRIALTITLMLALSATAVPLGADPAPTTQPDPHAAAQPPAESAGPVTAAAPTTQPETTAAAPNGNGELAQRSQIRFLLERNLPERLYKKNLSDWIAASSEQKDHMRGTVRTILGRSEAELDVLVARKSQFEALSPEEQERKRQRAGLIEQVLDRLSPTEQARLLSMPPDQMAKRVLELAAELKIQQSRVTPQPAAPKPKP